VAPSGGSAAHRAQYTRLEELLAAPDAATRRDALKAEIIALYRVLERELAELTQLKDGIRELAQKWKTLDPSAMVPMEAPQPAAAPVESGSTRADHLNASTYIEKGWNLISLGDFAGAEAALGKALSFVPNDAQAESLLGWAQMLQEKYDDALLHFQRVLMREPTNALARVNVGYICLKKHIFGEAIEHLSKAIRLDSDRKATLYAHYYLGLLYLERDMFEDAQNFFRKAIALGPNLVEAYYELGRACWFGGATDDARKAWRDGAAANKFNPWGKRCAEMLRHVESGGAPTREPSSSSAPAS
jgi:tetratricopeptide (TPR) repeat protein